MGRTATKVTPIEEGPVINETALARLGDAAKENQLVEHQEDAHVRAIARQLGYQLPADSIDPDLIQRDITANMRRSVEACLEVGRGLAVLKAACDHGSFLKRLDVLGVDRKVAAKFMQAAAKFANVSSTRHLTQAIGNQTKLFEMLILDDEQIDELALTGETGELHLDDIATMSVKELREALRQERKNVEFASEKRQKAEAERDDAEKKLHAGGPVVLPLDERISPFQVEIAERQSLIEKALLAHDQAITALDAWWEQERRMTGDDGPVPPAVLAVAQHLYDDIERLAALVGGLQHRVFETFGNDITTSRQYLLQDPALADAGDDDHAD